MASISLEVDDSSPLISYSPAGVWVDLPSNDSSISSYFDKSAHVSSVQGATATIQFIGTGIQIFGAQRPGYGTYSINVDGQVQKNGSASGNSDAFDQLLGSVEGLPNGLHTVALTNTGVNTKLDIDRMILSSQIGSSGNKAHSLEVEDRDGKIIFTPSGAWNESSSSEFSAGSTSGTSSPEAQASLEFTGDAVAIYGSVSPRNANLQVEIDGQVSNSTVAESSGVSGVHTQTLLYFGTNLGSQPHNLTVKSVSGGGGSYWDIDNIVVYGSSKNISAGNSAQENAAHARSSLLIGVAVGLVFLILAILAALFTVVRHYRRATDKLRRPVTPVTPALPLQINPDIEAGKFSPVPLTPAVAEKFGSRPPDVLPVPILTTSAPEAVPPPPRSGVPRDARPPASPAGSIRRTDRPSMLNL